jgi:hypothetical protein
MPHSLAVEIVNIQITSIVAQLSWIERRHVPQSKLKVSELLVMVVKQSRKRRCGAVSLANLARHHVVMV